MKSKNKYINLIFAIVLLLSGCQDKISETFMANSPIYLSYEDLRSAVKVEISREIEKPGKIYFKDNYVFVNELMQGVHVIDISDPSNPDNIQFIEIPGNKDIAIKENVLYADSYVDLVTIDVADLNNVEEIGRLEDIFPYTIPEYDKKYRMTEIDEEKGMVVDWEIEKVTQELVQNYYPVYPERVMYDSFANLSFGMDRMGVGGGGGAVYGVGGSMARFGLYMDYLYIVDYSNLYTVRITDINNPVQIGEKNIGWDIETMFIYGDHMFLGTRSGMQIFSLENEQYPTKIGQYDHIRSCDPVVVQDDMAYVTLHDGNECGRSVNRLDVIKMSDGYTEFELLKSYNLTNPHGLGIDDDILFICDGDAGLKVFDATDPLQISSNLIAEFPDINTYDVIPLNSFLFMIGSEGFYLYDYSDLQNISLLSTIPVTMGN